MNTKLRKSLRDLSKAIVEEAERNPQFEQQLKDALNFDNNPGTKSGTPKRRYRREPAILDPIDLVRNGEEVLRKKLASLHIEQLKDIVANYGMDPSKKVMKWKSSKNIINRIVEISTERAQKGDAFSFIALVPLPTLEQTPCHLKYCSTRHHAVYSPPVRGKMCKVLPHPSM